MALKINANKIELVPLKDIKLNPKNRNKHSPEQIAQFVKILRYQGNRNPGVISNRSGLLVAGEGRYLAMKEAGETHMPVMFQDFEDEEQEYLYGISDNAIASQAALDLAEIHVDLKDMGPFDLDLLGIRDFQFEPDPETQGDPDAVPEVPKAAKTKRGELWALGSHRLLIDDCTVKENVERLMAGVKAEITFTSPPYNLGRPFTNRSGIGDKKTLYGDDANDEMSSDEYLSFLSRFSCEAMAISSYAFINLQQLSGNRATLVEWLNGVRTQLVETFVWVKTNPPPIFHELQTNSGFEYVFCLTAKENSSRKIETATFGRGQLSNVFTSGVNSGNEFASQHGATFPVEFAEHFITNFSKQSVFEPFAGSGSTLIACEKTNRRCYGMEIEPLYGDVILTRYAKFTGRDPLREDGMRWSELNG